MNVSFDIETIPDQGIIDRLPEPEVKTGNLKDPEKIAAKEAEAKSTQLEKMALDPLTGRICCVGFYGLTKGEQFSSCIEKPTDEDERMLIKKTFSALSDDVRLITWNGIGFDLPFLFKRAMILNVDPLEFGIQPLTAYTKRYNTEKHVDLMQVFGGWRDYVKLNTVAGLMFDAKKDDIDVTQLEEIMQTAEGRAKIERYCLRDAELTYRIFGMAQGCLFE